MKNPFKGSISRKLKTAFIMIISISFISSISSFMLIIHYNYINKVHDDLLVLVNEISYARIAEKDFLLYERKSDTFLKTGKSGSIDSLMAHLTKAEQIIQYINKNRYEQDDVLTNKINVLEKFLKRYKYSFSSLSYAFAKRGFKDYGLEGEMRQYIHDLEKYVSLEERVFVLTLRRHEKDFFLRKDEKYIKSLQEAASDFEAFIQSNGKDNEYKTKALQAIRSYTSHFNKIAALEKEIGLSEKDGLLEALSYNADNMKPGIDFLVSYTTSLSKRLQRNFMTMTCISFVLLLIVGGYIGFKMSTSITSPIIKLNVIVQKVMNGNMGAAEELETIDATDETANLTQNLKKMLNDLKHNMHILEEKNLKLAVSIEKEEKRNYQIKSIAQFSDLLKSNYGSFEEMGVSILQNLVNYTGCSLGALYMLNESEEPYYMETIACYAYGRVKKRKEIFYLGEGLPGACWQEKDVIFLTEIPDNYIKIRSGLGGASPTCIIVVPIVSDEKVEGIIELASFQILEADTRDLVYQLTQRIASSLSSFRIAKQNEKLIQYIESREAHLNAKEEEMQKNRDQIIQVNNRLIMLDELISKVFNGQIITNERFEIIHMNEYVADKLGYSPDTIGKPIYKFFRKEHRDIIEAFLSNPLYIVNGISSSIKTEIIDQFNNSLKIKIIVANLNSGKKGKYIFLFNTLDYKKTSKDLLKNLKNKVL